ncbi:MAG: RHS repeat-associated core domain-containing protein, partial [bacterium]|nr:RHS repeat-associated core domain-containing protein [bacterium]
MALVGPAFLVDGGAISWTLEDDTYTVRSAASLAAGEHTLRVDAGAPFDLAGKGLEEAFEAQVNVEDGTDSTEIYYRPDPRSVALGSLVNRFTFHGRPFDPETGLYYFRNRYFDPELGRFITADPLGYVDGPAMYQFARYAPFVYTDSLGLQTNPAALRVPPGPAEQTYYDYVARYGDPRNPPAVRVVNFLYATLTAPAALVEMTGRGIANIPYGITKNTVEASKDYAQAEFVRYPEERLKLRSRATGRLCFAFCEGGAIVIPASSYARSPVVNFGKRLWNRLLGRRPPAPLEPSDSLRVRNPEAPKGPAALPVASEAQLGGGRIFSHFTDAKGVKGITGIGGESLEVGQQVVVRQLRFGSGRNPFMAGEPGAIFVTELGPATTSGKLNAIGVFSNKQQFVIQFSEEAAFSQGIRITGERQSRSIFSIPGDTTLEGVFDFVVTRIR